MSRGGERDRTVNALFNGVFKVLLCPKQQLLMTMI